jgi:L-arabinose isomerase
VFTARYALSPYIKQIRFVFKGLNNAAKIPFQIFNYCFMGYCNTCYVVCLTNAKETVKIFYLHRYSYDEATVETFQIHKVEHLLRS